MRLFLALVVIGIAITVFGCQEYRLSKVTKAEAQRMSCADLERNGPGDNAHILLTDFATLPSYVYEAKRDKWTAAWVPVVALDSPHVRKMAEIYARDGANAKFPPPKELRVLMKLGDARSAADVDRVGDQETVEGIVINEISSLPSKTRALLQTSYPNVDLDKCWIFEPGRAPKSAAFGIGIMVLGVGLATGTGFFAFRRRRSAGA